MIQDIGSSKLDNSFNKCTPSGTDIVMSFNASGKVMVAREGDCLRFPTAIDIERVATTNTPTAEQLTGATTAMNVATTSTPTAAQTTEAPPAKSNEPTGGTLGHNSSIPYENIVYLFSVDNTPYYLWLAEEEAEVSGFSYEGLRLLRGACRNVDLLVVFTAYHLWRWYMDNKVCGRCGHKLNHKDDERALVCPSCKNTVYPRINPAVIVGVTKGENLLITRYRTGYAHNALVAGFTEIGETLEQTVAREVMEETGVKVKNIRYYKSQPWGMAQDILAGFFCEADGDGEIKMDETELKYAEWVPRNEIELQPNDLSLTNEMMKVFKSKTD